MKVVFQDVFSMVSFIEKILSKSVCYFGDMNNDQNVQNFNYPSALSALTAVLSLFQKEEQNLESKSTLYQPHYFS